MSKTQGTWSLHAWLAPAQCARHHAPCCREWAAHKDREALQAAARAGQADQLERHLRHLQQQLAAAVSELSHSRQLQLDLAGKRWCLRLSKAAAVICLAVHSAGPGRQALLLEVVTGCSSRLACRAHTLAAVSAWPSTHLQHQRWERCAPAGALEESREELAGARQAARLYNQAMDEVQRLRGENGVLRRMLQVSCPYF